MINFNATATVTGESGASFKVTAIDDLSGEAGNEQSVIIDDFGDVDLVSYDSSSKQIRIDTAQFSGDPVSASAQEIMDGINELDNFEAEVIETGDFTLDDENMEEDFEGGVGIGTIKKIEEQIIQRVEAVTQINQYYNYPVADIGRNLPALVNIYDGFSQNHEAARQTDTTYNFEFTLYLPAEGKTLQKNWNDMKRIVPLILNEFRRKADLGCTVWGSIISAGNTIIDAQGAMEGRKTRWIGHTFTLQATKTEA